MAMGQPTKYREEFCQRLIDWMAQGKSYITWGPKNDPPIAVRTMYLWEEKYEQWREAKQTGYALGLAHYEKLLNMAMMGIVTPDMKKMGSKGVNITALIFTLKTRFHKEYGDLQKVEHIAATTPLEINFIDDKKQLEDKSIEAEYSEVKKN